MNANTILFKSLLIISLLLVGNIGNLSAQENLETKPAKEENLKVLGDPGKGLFFVQYKLPKDAKKVIWTVSDEKGEVLIKEKFKKVKAGKNRFQYNYLHGPDGLHTHKLVADGEEIGTIEVLKKKK